MTSNEMTFGVEFEVTLPNRVQIEVGRYHAGRQVAGLPMGWNAQGDCSIQTIPGRYGVEIVSPVLKGQDGINQVLAVVAWLNSIGAKVNQSTGFHVHVGFDRSNVTGLKRLVHLVASFEKAIYASTGTNARETGRFCRSIRNEFRNLNYTNDAIDGRVGYAAQNRYHVLNVSNLVNGMKPTVEFRAFAGTLNANKVLGHVFMCLGLVEKAINAKRTGKYDQHNPVKGSPIHRSGEGQSQLARLFYLLGWTKGDTKKVYGTIEVEGAPEIKSIKSKLMEMAKKYDTGAELVNE